MKKTIAFLFVSLAILLGVGICQTGTPLPPVVNTTGTQTLQHKTLDASNSIAAAAIQSGTIGVTATNSLQLGGIAASAYLLSSTAATTYQPIGNYILQNGTTSSLTLSGNTTLTGTMSGGVINMGGLVINGTSTSIPFLLSGTGAIGSAAYQPVSAFVSATGGTATTLTLSGTTTFADWLYGTSEHLSGNLTVLNLSITNQNGLAVNGQNINYAGLISITGSLGSVIPYQSGTAFLTSGTLPASQVSGLGSAAFKAIGDPTILSGGSGALNLSNFTLTLPVLTINFRHDYLSALQTLTLGVGEPAWAIDYKRLYVGDGSTLGGIPVSGIPQLSGSDWTTPFTTSNANDLYLVTGTGSYSNQAYLVFKTGSANLPLFCYAGNTSGYIPPVFTSGLLIPAFSLPGTGTNPNNSAIIMPPIAIYNSVSNGTSSSTGTGGSVMNTTPTILLSSLGNGGNSSGAGNGGNGSNVSSEYLINSTFGSGGATTGAGNGGNGGQVIANNLILQSAGNGGAGAAANGGNGGALGNYAGLCIYSGNGGDSGSVSGANGGAGGQCNGTKINNQSSSAVHGNILIGGGVGGAGGASSGANGGTGGGSPTNLLVLHFVGGAGGAGGTYAGGNGGNFGYTKFDGGAGGAGSGSSAGGIGGNGGYISVNGGAASTSGGNGGNGGAFTATGGAATSGSNGMNAGILDLSANGTAVQNGTITWGNGNVTSIPTTTGTLGMTPIVLSGTLTSGSTTITNTAFTGAHPWVQDTATSMTNVGALAVTVSGSTATIKSSSASDASTFNIFVILGL